MGEPAGARHGHPRAFSLPRQWDDLEETIGDLERSRALESVLRLAREHGATRALLEVDYIDADYRNEYANFYAQTFRTLSNRCRRLHFFKRDLGHPGERYLGFCVLRPIPSRPVGRTFLAPPAALAPYVACTTRATAHPYGQQLHVAGFPFMEQDAQLGVCAHASVWMVALYHHLKHQSARQYVSDVASGANARSEGWRNAPSEGLTDEQVGTALQAIDLPPIAYPVDDPPHREDVHEIVCRYLNSRLPVVLTTPGHVTVLVGYGRDTSGDLFFIRSDEGTGPYERVYEKDDPLGKWDLLIAPLPGRIYLAGETAEPVARLLFKELLNRPEHRDLRRRLGTDLRLRSYVRRASEYKQQLSRRGLPAEAATAHRLAGTSNWVWIVELQDPALARLTPRCVLGEIAIDATSDRLDPNPLFGNLAGRRYTWGAPDQRMFQQAMTYKGPYLSDAAIHDAPTAPPISPTGSTVERWLKRRRQAVRLRQRNRRRQSR